MVLFFFIFLGTVVGFLANLIDGIERERVSERVNRRRRENEVVGRVVRDYSRLILRLFRYSQKQKILSGNRSRERVPDNNDR